jgi:glycosyltransferase involved in cell wall biosynthesis
MKIAYCIPSLYYPGGMERVLTLKVNYLVETYGYEVHIILTDGKTRRPYYSLNPSVRIHQLDVNYDHLYGKLLPQRIWGYFVKQRQFKSRLNICLNQIKPDMTISLLRREINFISKMTDGSIKIGEIHFNKSNYREFSNNKFPHFVQKEVRQYWMGQLIRKLRRLKRFVVLSEEDAKEWVELSNVEVISNPLSFNPDKQSSCDSKRVIADGRYMPQKGFDRLIPAWKLVAEQHPDWQLHIYGDGNRAVLESLIVANQVQTSCFLEHNVPNIVDKYCESSIFVLFSRFEGFGMVLTEAMICGVPPVSFACPCGPRDIIQNGQDGFLVANGNINGLADKICYLIEHEDIRKEMGIKAKENVKRYLPENIMPKWKVLFESVLASQ